MLDKKYDPQKIETGKYQNWVKKGYFTAGDLSKKPFCIVIPPPNVTGKLHLGHAWDTTLQDIIIRYKRMDGYDALWIPGMDHAGIATQAKVDRKLKDMGYQPRAMDREEWLKHAWEWKKEYADNIHAQWEKLGLSLDYTKERFTLDEGLSKAVKHVFVTLYKKGYIYRGERIINWDPEAMTALSNEEVIYQDDPGAFYHLKYFIEDTDQYLEVATTRPETLFGDTAVAVNPKDPRYQHLIGKHVILPIVNKPIPIVGDDHADMEFGTGVVKITPAHDPNDFEVGNRHHLERIIVMNPDATMNEHAGKYKGMDRFQCRKALVKDLKEQGLLIQVEEMVHSVGHSERTGVAVEPYLSKQWFVKMDILAKQVLDNQKTQGKVQFIPNRFEKILNHWMEDCHDWCISRQLWWGHQIPAWYRGEEVYVGDKAPTGDGWVRDSDVLDTWFSSALWPFSTLGWPEDTDMMKRYFPNNVLVTGYDIIFFWVCRMVFQSLEFTKERPFNDILIHGLVRDKQGRKMSKSLGNGVDPMDVIELYGTDALRFFLTTSSAPGMDLRYDEEKVKSTWNFINKLWNASRFVLMNIEGYDATSTLENLKLSDKWILNKLNKTIATVRKHMDQYEFQVVGAELYNFIWNDFCDWYIELSKIEPTDSTKETLIYVLKNILKMLHPFMPFVTEEIYTMLPDTEESIMVSDYPKVAKEFAFADTTIMDTIIDFIVKVRRIKLENQIGKDYYLVQNSDIFTDHIDIISNMLKIDKNDILNETNRDDLDRYEITFGDEVITLYYDGTSNHEQERANLERDRKRLEASIERRKKLLANTNYTSKAPSHIVEAEQNSLEKEEKELELVMSKLN
jgi:valyl-tRNA synthetase